MHSAPCIQPKRGIKRWHLRKVRRQEISRVTGSPARVLHYSAKQTLAFPLSDAKSRFTTVTLLWGHILYEIFRAILQYEKLCVLLFAVHEKQCSLPHWMLQHHHTFNNLNGSVKYHFNTLGTSLTIIQANVTKKLKCSTIEEDINSNLSRIVMQVNFEW